MSFHAAKTTRRKFLSQTSALLTGCTLSAGFPSLGWGQQKASVVKVAVLAPSHCALPMIYAEQERLQVDAFVFYTDNETWAGEVHASQRLAQYRKKTGIPAKMVVVGMTATEFTVADPNDAGQMDVVGFDTAAPAIINDFIDGKSADEEKTEG